MSLKGFHIFFIALAALLAFGIGAWCIWVNSFASDTGYIVAAIICFAFGVGLAFYAGWFFRKMKRLRLYT